ncbi:hypothetical protein VPH35_080284 [Triticum aestivum]
MFLAFDPAVSQHHRVFFFPTEKLQRYEEEQHGTSSRAKLPCWVDWEHTPLPNLFGEEPAAKVFHAFLFSSQTGRWESREFTPGRCASGHLYDVVTALRRRDQRTWWSAEYWHGSLYVHCHSDVLMVLRCSQGTYDMVRLPGHPHDGDRLDEMALPERYLEHLQPRPQKGLPGDFFAQAPKKRSRSYHRGMGWTLAHKADLKGHDRIMNYLRMQPLMSPKITWAMVESDKDLISLFEHDDNEEINDDCSDGTGEDGYEKGDEEVEVEEEEDDDYNGAHDEEEEEQHIDDETQGEQEEEQYIYDSDEHAELQNNSPHPSVFNYSWNSDEHNFIDLHSSTIAVEDVWEWGCNIVGFHPYKDALHLKFSDLVVPYHLQTSRMQYLGNMYPRQYYQHARDVHAAFPYRPCYVDALPPRKISRSS